MAKDKSEMVAKEVLEREAVQAMLRSAGWDVFVRDIADLEQSAIEQLILSDDVEDEKLKGEVRAYREVLLIPAKYK